MVHSLLKTVWQFLLKIKITLPYDLAILFLGICTKEINAYVSPDTYMPMSIAVWFIIAPKWKYSNVHQLVNKMGYIYTAAYVISNTKEWTTDTCCHMEVPQKYYVKKPDMKDYILIPFLSYFSKIHIYNS